MSSTPWIKITASFVISALLFNFALSEKNFNTGPEIKYLNHTSGSLKLKDSNLKEGTYIWVITPVAKNITLKVNLFFDELFLHEDDAVTVFKTLDDATNGTNPIIEPIRAQNGTITIITDEPSLVVKLQGNTTAYQRIFGCAFTSESCVFPIPPSLRIINSPIYKGNGTTAECKYTYAHDPHYRVTPMFQFDVYNFTTSTVDLDGTTYPFKTYDKKTPMDFFHVSTQNAMSIDVKINDMSEFFRLNMRMVDSECSRVVNVKLRSEAIESPNYAFDNGTFGNECVWVVRQADTKILGVAFAKLDFANVLDIVAVNDGGTENSPPLYQVTTSNTNDSMTQLLRSSGPYLWISFKPVNYHSKMSANITVHGQGGHFTGSGEISMIKTDGNDTIFMLEVEEKESVLLNFTSADFTFPATLKIYDGFDTKNLIATLHESVWYPVLSPSSKMMIIATAFNSGSFKATFKGVAPGCLHMSSLTNQNYDLSGNCNSTCLWIIPPQNLPGSVLLLDLQYISLDKEDTIEIYELDAAKTLIGSVDSTAVHVPQMVFPANTGALVEITRKPCAKKDKVVLVGHSSFVPVCGGTLDLKPTEHFHITSPLYPDTYPLLANCTWTLLAPAKSLIHLAFDKFTLAPNHCLRIFDSKTNASTEMSASQLPDDLFLTNGSSIDFSSFNCKASKPSLQLVSSEGFMLNGTVAECGDVFGKEPGQFNVNVTSLKQSLCMWKVSVPPTSDDAKESVNIIGYTVTVKEAKGNFVLKVFDGASVRDSEISNISTTEVWSRTNDLIFYYQRQNVSLPSSVFVIKYKVITCNSTSLCANNVCMHPDWRCNGVNECGDFTDELNCGSVPIPPKEETSGYSATAFWLTFFVMLIIGALVGVGILFFYQKYKNGQYHRFSDMSVIE